ncbi:hypothetical protein Ancab_005362 [Ancistrocladus abbreviatus]
MAAQLYLCCVLFIFYVLQSSPTVAAAEVEVEVANSIRSINFGVIINEDTRVGKEHKVAMKIAVQNFNDRSKNFNLSLHFRNSNGHAFQAASAVNSTVISSMEGVLGIKTHYSETSREFNFFYYRFWKEFRTAYPEEWNSQPGIHALQAFDAITAITMAIEHLGAETGSSTKLLETILSSKFDGLSSKISFQGGELQCNPVFRVINVVGKGHKELDFWSAENHFFERLGDETGRRVVTWPGDTNEVPKGWALPTNAKPLRIGVPGKASFEKSVRVDKDNNSNRTERLWLQH